MRADATDLRHAVARLTIQFTALILVLFILVGGLVLFIVSTSIAETSARTVHEAAEVGSVADAADGVYVAQLTGDKLSVTPRAPAAFPNVDTLQEVAASGGTVTTSQTLDDHEFTVQTRVYGDAVVQVAVDQHESSEELSRLLGALIIATAIATVAAAIVANLMARRAFRPMAQALELQRRFVADASHELRTPLTLLSTRAQMLRRTLAADASAPEAKTAATGLDAIVADTRVLTDILDDLLIAADPRETAAFVPVDLAAVADSAVQAMNSGAATKSVSLTRTGSPSAVMVVGTRAALSRIFTALIGNALDHASTAVTVEVTCDAEFALIRVTDDGPGFSPSMREHAFERFASTRSTDADALDSSPRHYGLGLALVAEVAKRHGGSVRLDPSEGNGASVSVRLPLLRPADFSTGS